MHSCTNYFLNKLTPFLLIKIFELEYEDLANKKHVPTNFVKLLRSERNGTYIDAKHLSTASLSPK